MAISLAVSHRTYPMGAELLEEGTHFRVWAPEHRKVELVVENKGARPQSYALDREDSEYYSGVFPQIPAGTLYRFHIDSNDHLHPDPASRYQPLGVHGPSCVMPGGQSYPWTDSDWKGITMPGQVLYEMHIGTYTRQGTWRSATEQFAEIARLGITVIEMMPVAEFYGSYGWGYDGVDLFAPTRNYGTPDDLRFFVDQAHANGLGVILDVVYNHLGPEGNYLRPFSHHYFTDRYATEWGEAINFELGDGVR